MRSRLGIAGALIVAVIVTASATPVVEAATATISCVAPSGPAPVADLGAGFHGLGPERAVDTRTSAPVPAGCWLRVPVPASVPLDAAAIVVNLTAVDAPEVGFLTAHPCGTGRGSTSAVNVHVTAPTSRLSIVPVGPERELCVYSDRQSDVIVDLFGWFGPGGSPLHQIAALRALDTRSPLLRPPEVDGIIEPGERVSLDRQALGIPDHAAGVVVNLTATQAEGWGFLTGFPCAGGRPATSNINYDEGIDRAGLAMIALGPADSLCLEVGNRGAHAIVDVVAWFGDSPGIDNGLRYDIGTARVADTRHASGLWAGPFAAGETRELDAIGEMPVGTEVATLGITATRATGNGFVQVRPCGQIVGTSSLNYVAGRDITNLVTVPVAGDGSVCVTASAPTDLVIDVFGGFGQGELIKTFDVGPFEIFPEFDPGVTDYAAFCAEEDGNTFDVELLGAPGTTMTVVGHGTGTPALSATPTVAADDAIVVTISSPTGFDAEYWFRCLPPDFPHVSTTRFAASTPGWYLVGNANFPRPPGEFAMILDSNAVPVWYRRAPNAGGATRVVLDVKRWADGSIAWVVAAPSPWGIDPTLAYERFTLDGTPVATHTTTENPGDPGVARPLDHHDLEEMPDGNLLMVSYVPRTRADTTTYDCVADNGDPRQTNIVLDAVIQEVDAVSGALVKEWSSDVFGLSGVPKIDIGAGGSDLGEVRVPRCFDHIAPLSYDAIHANALAPSADGSQVLFSARHLDAVYSVDWATGDIAWKLGGTATPESLSIVGDPHAGPRRQHDVRVLPNGNVSMFDNQTTLAGAVVPASAPARYVEYSIDETARTATLVRSVERPDGAGSGAMGSARLQPDGAVVISWGAVPGPTFSEFDTAGNLAFDVRLDAVFSYRVVKEPMQSFDLADLRATAGG